LDPRPQYSYLTFTKPLFMSYVVLVPIFGTGAGLYRSGK
jgi:hypothetical protein